MCNPDLREKQVLDFDGWTRILSLVAPPAGRSHSQHLGPIGGCVSSAGLLLVSLCGPRGQPATLVQDEAPPLDLEGSAATPSAGEAAAAVCVFAEDVRSFTRVRCLLERSCGRRFVGLMLLQ